MSNREMTRTQKNRCSTLWMLITFIAVSSSAIAADKQFQLIAPGSALPRVVSGDRPLEQDAARDLCHYLSRISGQNFAVSDKAGNARVVIHVGRDTFVARHVPKIDTIRSDGYMIRCIEHDDNMHLVLAGKVDRAAQWAVERFLG